MASKLTVKVQDLIKELSAVKENVERIENNNDNKHCHCNKNNELTLRVLRLYLMHWKKQSLQKVQN